MRVLQREAATDADVVLLPVRCAATARLKGFEVLACKPEPSGLSDARNHKPMYARAAARRLAQVLSGELMRLVAGHGLRLWIPLSLNSLRCDATVLFDGIAMAGLEGDNITFELAASDVLAGIASPKQDLLAALRAQSSRIAVSGLSDFASIEGAFAKGQISEVRLSATLCGIPSPPGFASRLGGRWLAETVVHLHERGLLATAVDVSDTRLCHEVIIAGFDLIQGDLVGRPHSVEAAVDQMVAALPFGRTLL
jgi:EAL domain-containing protein (putative c-di-GMP-specific phosphodiesterase class I)